MRKPNLLLFRFSVRERMLKTEYNKTIETAFQENLWINPKYTHLILPLTHSPSDSESLRRIYSISVSGELTLKRLSHLSI